MRPSSLRTAGLAALACLVVVGCAAARAAAAGASWSSGYTLVLLSPGADERLAMDLVRAHGGGIGVVVPPRVLLGWIPPAADAALVGHAGIQSIHRSPLATLPADLDDPSARAAVRSFGRAVRGELDPTVAPPDDATQAAPRMLPDALDRPPIDLEAVRANLRAAGKPSLAAALPDERLAGTSDTMSGTVSVTLFFVESDGSGSDPDLNDWSAQAEQEVFDGAVSGLSFWSTEALDHAGCWVAFYVRAHFATEDARLEQPLEPVLHASGDYAAAVSSVLANFGYTSGTHLARATAYDNWARTEYDTDWAYCAFVAANPSGPNEFTDGRSAWAYLGGPYTALLQHSFGWAFGQVFPHETGHIFGACDEYYEPGYGGCTSCGPCGPSGAPNGNCEYCSTGSVNCMMKLNSWTLCLYTPAQLGWTNNPCAPVSLPPPQVTSAAPDQMIQDGAGTIVVEGQDFTYGSLAEFGPGVAVLDVRFISPTLLEVDVDVDLEAAPGLRDVLVRTPDQQQGVLPGAFEVLATRRHYVAAGGSGSHPFITPASAGSSLAAVAAACSEGDTLLVAAGTYGAVQLQKSITLLGGWDAGFVSRDPEVNSTIVDAGGLAPAIRLDGSGKTPVVDGVVVRGGAGEYVTAPELGTVFAGGGVRCYQASARLTDCIIENNTSGAGATAGVGAGVMVWAADCLLERCTIRDNQANRGAGVFVLNGDVQLVDCRIEDNLGDASTGTARGAGLAALGSRVSMLDVEVLTNTGAGEGGGLHFEACPDIDLEGVLVQGNASTGPGGGLYAQDSQVALRACDVRSNTAGGVGAGISARNDSLEVLSSVVAGNTTSALGGGVHTNACLLLMHNATVARNNGSFASGVFSEATPPAGEILNSIVAENTTGGVVIFSGTPPALDWNLVWGNGAFDYLGTPAGPHDTSVDPVFADGPGLDLHLALHSPAIDSGDPDPAQADPDGSRNDRGAYGGPPSRSAAPPFVTGLQAAAAGPLVNLSWAASPALDVALYAVHRSPDSTLVVTPSAYLESVPAPATAWVDSTVVNGVWYAVQAVDDSGYAGGWSLPVRLDASTDVARSDGSLRLHVASPTTLARGAWLWFDLPRAGRVRLDVYSIDGRRLRRLAEGEGQAGPVRLHWDGRDDGGRSVAAGVYVVRLETSDATRMRKLVLAR